MKIRLDVLISNNESDISREKAKAMIMAGSVYIDNQKADKAGMMVKEDCVYEIRGKQNPYVSRGGLKLAKSIDKFCLDLNDCICMDIGASTGGFTDCMLQNGANKVYAVDVGYGQLAWKLRTDDRVINLERTNIRYLEEDVVPDKIDFVSIDVSFISLKLVLPVAKKFLKDGGRTVALIKPQFEAGRENVGKKGVVRDKSVHIDVIKSVVEFAKEINFTPIKLDFSPVKGPEGNIEYLLLLEKSEITSEIDAEMINDIVESSHNKL